MRGNGSPVSRPAYFLVTRQGIAPVTRRPSAAHCRTGSTALAASTRVALVKGCFRLKAALRQALQFVPFLARSVQS